MKSPRIPQSFYSHSRPHKHTPTLQTNRIPTKLSPPTFHTSTKNNSHRVLKCTSSHSSHLYQSIRCFSFTYPSARQLSDIIKIDKFLPHTTAEIQDIWSMKNIQNQQKPNNTTVEQYSTHTSITDRERWDRIAKRMKESIRCIIPVITKLHSSSDTPAPDQPLQQQHRSEAVECEYWNALCEIQDTRICLVTFIENYRAAASQVIPSLSITFFNDLLNEKNIILLRSDIIIPTDFTIQQATFFIDTLLYMYENEEIYKKYVYTVNHRQDAFDVNALLRIVSARYAKYLKEEEEKRSREKPAAALQEIKIGNVS